MKKRYDDLSLLVSKNTTQAYSTSFSLGILFLHKRVRTPIYAIYGFVRVADEIVDSFAGYNQSKLLKKFREDTFEAIEDRISANPILNSFQRAVHQYDMDLSLIETFLDSMEMDLEQVHYTREKYQKYILGSAEVVGLMCLHVFCEGDKNKYQELRPYAMKLGAAFQKVNFLRDLKDDYHILGRSYFPGIDLQDFSQVAKEQIEREIEEDFRIALEGIKKLPPSSKGGVYLAYVYFRSLFRKIQRLPPKRIFSERIRIHNGHKLGLMLNSFIITKMDRV